MNQPAGARVESGCTQCLDWIDATRVPHRPETSQLATPMSTRLYTSIADWPFDIWMLEGFR